MTRDGSDPPGERPGEDSKAFQETPADALARLPARSVLADEAAFAALYDATSTRVFGLVLRLVRSRAIAEEVTKEVYLQAWRSASKFDESRGTASSWLMTVAHRRAVDRIRTSDGSSRRDTAYQNNDSIDFDETLNSAAAPIDAVSVRSRLASLSDIQRQVLELAYLDGHTHAETAEIVGIPLGSAKTQIRDGLNRLRTLIAAAN